MMHQRGLTKLMEECGELSQIAAKKSAFMDRDDHPDGMGSMKERLENEIADVTAICTFVTRRMNLDTRRICDRITEKIIRFEDWEASEDLHS